MGWRFKWVSSYGTDFNYDYHVSFDSGEMAQGKVRYNYDLVEGYDELPGLSVFYKDENGDVFHTYSSFARGVEFLMEYYPLLDRAPKGRNETGLWMRRHDEYGSAA